MESTLNLEQKYMNNYVKLFNQAPFPLTKQEILKFHYEDVTHQFENLKKWKNEMDDIVKTWENELQDELDSKVEEGKVYGVFRIEADDNNDSYDCIAITDSILLAKKIIREDWWLPQENINTAIFIGIRGNHNEKNNYKYIIESMEINRKSFN